MSATFCLWLFWSLISSSTLCRSVKKYLHLSSWKALGHQCKGDLALLSVRQHGGGLASSLEALLNEMISWYLCLLSFYITQQHKYTTGPVGQFNAWLTCHRFFKLVTWVSGVPQVSFPVLLESLSTSAQPGIEGSQGDNRPLLAF